MSFQSKPAPGVPDLVWGCSSKFSKICTEPACSPISWHKPPVITTLTLRAWSESWFLTDTLSHHGLGAPCWPHSLLQPVLPWQNEGGTCCPRHPVPLPQHLQHSGMRGTDTFALLPPQPSRSHLLPKAASQQAHCQPLPPRSRTIMCFVPPQLQCQMVAYGTFPPDPMAAALHLSSHKNHPSWGVLLLHAGTQRSGCHGCHIFCCHPERSPLQNRSNSTWTKGRLLPTHTGEGMLAAGFGSLQSSASCSTPPTAENVQSVAGIHVIPSNNAPWLHAFISHHLNCRPALLKPDSQSWACSLMLSLHEHTSITLLFLPENKT